MNYENIFNQKQKAEAFDRLAELYYQSNFGTLQKSEIDLLMFSILLDRISDEYPDDYELQSDYQLARSLGITQARVRSLKERAELRAINKYKWQEEFRKVCERAELENDKIKLYIREVRLYTELKHVLEVKGWYAEATLTRQMLVVPPLAFIDIMIEAEDEGNREVLINRLNGILEKNNIKTDPLKGKSLREQMKKSAPKIVADTICEFFKMVPVVGGPLAEAVKGISEGVQEYYRKK